jgi:hypothetical protein
VIDDLGDGNALRPELVAIGLNLVARHIQRDVIHGADSRVPWGPGSQRPDCAIPGAGGGASSNQKNAMASRPLPTSKKQCYPLPLSWVNSKVFTSFMPRMFV